jgi:hypothetical protein
VETANGVSSSLSMLLLLLGSVACRGGSVENGPNSTLGEEVARFSGGSDLEAQVTVCYSRNFLAGSGGQCTVDPQIPPDERPVEPSCSAQPSGAGHHISITAGTKVTVRNVTSTGTGLLGNVITRYQVVGPLDLFKQASSTSCWIEEKYLDLDELNDGLDRASQSSKDDSGVVTSKVTKTYLKVSPIDSGSLLNSAPQGGRDGLFESLQRLPSALHDPKKACLLPVDTKIAFRQIRKAGAGGVELQNGHVFVDFSGARTDRVGTTRIGINYAGSAPSFRYYSQEPYLSHWQSLIAFYPQHPDFFRDGRDVSDSAIKIGLGCELTAGWLFVGHFVGWKSHLNLPQQ